MTQLNNNQNVGKSTSAITKRAAVNWIMLIYFASGACSLIDEVVWVRLLKLTLGNTVYAASIVVSVFMGGLALGALIMGRYSDRIKRRLQLYALLETLVTISALLLPWGLRLADNIYVWFYRSKQPTTAQLLIVQIIISAAILLVPSMLMGSTLPLLGRFVTSLEKEAGHLVGRLYALNTFGAAVGCFLAGFVLIRFLGVMGALYTAAVLNLLVAFGGWILSRLSKVEVQAHDSSDEQRAVGHEKVADGRFYVLIFAFFMSGLISIGYELLWMRSIVHLLGGFSAYVFSAVLTVYLLGNVIGAGIGSKLVKKLKNPAVGFGVTLSLLGLYGVFYLPLLVLWISKVRPYIDAKVELLSTFVAFSTYMVKPLVQCVLLFLGPAVLMGIGFPIALQAWANHIHKVGRSTGTAYGANTIGAVIGGVLTGFILIPLLGLQLAISTLGLAGLWIAGIMCLLFARSSKASLPHEDEPSAAGARGRFILLVAAVILTVVVVKTPSNLFEIVVETNPRLPKQLKLLMVKEGVTATASVYRDLEEDTLWLYVSGQKVAGDTYFWRSDQKLLGHFGVLLNSQAKKVLSVGFGSGESTACLAMHKLERADCVEIAPEVVDVSLKFFTHINLGDKLNDYINMFYMDAKNYIHLTNIHYDAIVNDSIHPRHFAENASLYAKEFFETAREHLNDKGLLISWIPTHNVEPTSVLNSIIGTMMEVFPYVTIWYMTPSPAQYFLVVGSEQPQYFSPAHIENELNKKGVRESLSLIDINNNMDVMSCYIGDQDDIRRHIKSFSVNSDYLPFIEFTTDDQVGGPLMFKKFISEVRSTSVYKHIDWTGFSKEQKDKWLLDFDRLYAASSYLLASNGAGDYLERLKYSVEGLAILPDNPGLLHLRKRTEKDILSICMKKILSGETEDALLTSNDVINIYPESSVAWIIRSNVMQETGDMQRAYDAARMAVYHDPNSADAHFRLGSVLLINKQFEEAIKEYKDALRLVELAREFASYNQAQVLNSLTTAYAAAGRLPEAIAAAEKAFDFALSTGRKEMAEDIRKRLLSFESARTP